MITPEYWFRIITELERGMSLLDIAAKVGCSDSSLCRYKAGVGEPRYSVGHRLIALHRIHPANGMPHDVSSRVEPPG